MTCEQTGQTTNAVDAAVAGVSAAAARAQQLDYRGLAAALEDLATVLGALPTEDADRVAHALLSAPRSKSSPGY